MSNNYFSFKKFTICQDNCAMKVGVDGVLLGAWTHFEEKDKKVLDVGTGTGLMALMAGQRCQACITGIELDEFAARQACQNVESSPWADRIEVIWGDFLDYDFPDSYDVILSNPPYFKEECVSSNLQRHLARHNSSLTYENLVRKASRLLSPEGRLSLIAPAIYESLLRGLAVEFILKVTRLTYIHTKSGKPAKRLMMEMSREGIEVSIAEVLTIMDESGTYSEAYARLTQDFYLVK